MQFQIKSSIMDRVRLLAIENEYLEFDDKDLVNAASTRLYKADIKGIRFGIKWIEGYRFTIGRVYCIDVCDQHNQTIKIRLKSVYGVRRKALGQKYTDIIDALYQYFFNEMLGHYYQQLTKEDGFILLGVKCVPGGVSFKGSRQIIPWDDVELRRYISYFAICSVSQPEIYTTLEYLSEWNAVILHDVLYHIINNRSAAGV